GAAGEDRADESRQDDEDPEPDEENRAELCELVESLLLVVEKVELRLADSTARDEVVLARDGLPLVADLSGADEPAEVGGNLADAERDRRGERAAGRSADGERVAPPLVGRQQP